MIYTQNYPWSGRLGRIAKRCVYCGRSGRSFGVSSHSLACVDPECERHKNPDAKPIPEFMDQVTRDRERLAREWCTINRVDYEVEIRLGQV